MSRFPFQFFDNYIVRTPVLPYKKFETIFSSQKINHEKLEVFADGLFREAIYLDYLSLYNETKSKISEKSKISLLKYYNRASTRYTHSDYLLE